MDRRSLGWGATLGGLALLMSTAGPGPALAQSDQMMMGRHSMQGKVTSLDEKKGWVHLKTDEGTLIFRVPPESLQGVKKGDTVSVDLALKDNGPSSSSKRQ